MGPMGPWIPHGAHGPKFQMLLILLNLAKISKVVHIRVLGPKLGQDDAQCKNKSFYITQILPKVDYEVEFD